MSNLFEQSLDLLHSPASRLLPGRVAVFVSFGRDRARLGQPWKVGAELSVTGLAPVTMLGGVI
jgi:hypothetical protein